MGRAYVRTESNMDSYNSMYPCSLATTAIRRTRGTYHPLADDDIDVLDWQFDILYFALDDTIISFLRLPGR
jgi:hypothetical protein